MENRVELKTNKSNLLSKFFGDKKFVAVMFSLFIPAALQSLLSTSVIYVDNFFIASFAHNGTIAKTAIGVATSIINFPTMIVIAVLTGIGVLTSQYFGSKSKNELHQTITIKFLGVLIFVIPIILLLMLIPEEIIEVVSGIDTADPNHHMQTILTKEYLFWSAITFIPMSLAFLFSFSFRETKRPKISLLAAAIAISSNIVMDPLLVMFSESDLVSVRNIALSTFGARCIEVVILMGFIVFNKKEILRYSNFKIKFNVFINTLKNSWQVIINDILYGFATLFLIICLLRFDPSIHDASTTVSIIIQFTVVIFPGMSSSSSVLIGSELGSNNIEGAKQNSKYLICWSFLISSLFVLILFILSWFINNWLSPNATQESLILTQRMEWIMMPVILSQGMFSIIYYAIRSGGSSFVFFTDGVVMSLWCIIFGALTFTKTLDHLDPLLYFFLLEFNQIAKFILSVIVYKYTDWARNITHSIPKQNNSSIVKLEQLEIE